MQPPVATFLVIQLVICSVCSRASLAQGPTDRINLDTPIPLFAPSQLACEALAHRGRLGFSVDPYQGKDKNGRYLIAPIEGQELSAILYPDSAFFRFWLERANVFREYPLALPSVFRGCGRVGQLQKDGQFFFGDMPSGHYLLSIGAANQKIGFGQTATTTKSHSVGYGPDGSFSIDSNAVSTTPYQYIYTQKEAYGASITLDESGRVSASAVFQFNE